MTGPEPPRTAAGKSDQATVINVVADVLDEHTEGDDPYVFSCVCGWRSEDGQRATAPNYRLFQEHVAGVVVAALEAHKES